MEIKPLTLEGRWVRLSPLSLEYYDQLCAIGLDEDLWRVSRTVLRSPEDMRRYIETALAEQERGVSLPFVTIDKPSGTVVGCTRYGSIEPKHRRLEIGWTWIARNWQRTHVNTEAKLLMLRHAFEVLQCIRVEFKADSTNVRSRQALLRIGATEEGTLRNHMIAPGGRITHSVYYSIIESEWPDVKKRLEARLMRDHDLR
jgi:RimJ/RimL family protein N-acetyltransferase